MNAQTDRQKQDFISINKPSSLLENQEICWTDSWTNSQTVVQVYKLIDV